MGTLFFFMIAATIVLVAVGFAREYENRDEDTPITMVVYGFLGTLLVIGLVSTWFVYIIDQKAATQSSLECLDKVKKCEAICGDGK